MVGCELRDVDEPFHSVKDLDEGAEGDDLGNCSFEVITDVVGIDDALPRIILGLLETKRNSLAVAVDLEHLDLNRLADLEHLVGVVDVRPRNLRDVDQAVDPVEVNERAEVDDVRNLAFDDEPWLELIEDLLALTLACLFEHGTARKDDVVALTVDLNHLADDLRVQELVELGNAADVNQRCGQEATDAEVDDQATLYDLNDRSFDRLAGFGGGLYAAPGLFKAGALLRDDQTAFLILLREHQHVDLFT